MIIDSNLADRFIQRYSLFLLFALQQPVDVDDREELLMALQAGRDVYVNDRDLFGLFLKEHKGESPEIDNAIQSLEVGMWIYLRDTTKYSLFMNGDKTASYAVLGLSQPIKELFGGSGLFIETGLVRLGSRYVCDGLISKQVFFGKNYRNQFNSDYRDLKANGKFYKHAVT